MRFSPNSVTVQHSLPKTGGFLKFEVVGSQIFVGENFEVSFLGLQSYEVHRVTIVRIVPFKTEFGVRGLDLYSFGGLLLSVV